MEIIVVPGGGDELLDDKDNPEEDAVCFFDNLGLQLPNTTSVKSSELLERMAVSHPCADILLDVGLGEKLHPQ